MFWWKDAMIRHPKDPLIHGNLTWLSRRFMYTNAFRDRALPFFDSFCLIK